MSVDYQSCSYRELQAECKERDLGGKGSRDELIDKLVAADAGIEVEKDEKPAETKATDRGGYSLSPSAPDPHNPNYDRSGRWIRRGADGRPVHDAYYNKKHPAYKNFEKLREQLGDS